MPTVIDRNDIKVPDGTAIVFAGGESSEAVNRALQSNQLSAVYYISRTPETLVGGSLDHPRLVKHVAQLGRWNKDGVDGQFGLKIPYNVYKGFKLDFDLATTLPDFGDKVATELYGRSASGAAIPTHDKAGNVIDDGQQQHVLHRPADYRTLDALLPPDTNVGVITLKVGGREDDALQGAKQTIARCRPWILYFGDDAIYGTAGLRTRNDAIAWAKAVTAEHNYEHFFLGEGGRLTSLHSFDPEIHCRAVAAPGFVPRDYDFRVQWFVAAPRAR